MFNDDTDDGAVCELSNELIHKWNLQIMDTRRKLFVLSE